jgi:hypothetical protein
MRILLLREIRNLSECWRQDSDPSSFPFTVLHWKKKNLKNPVAYGSAWLCQGWVWWFYNQNRGMAFRGPE